MSATPAGKPSGALPGDYHRILFDESPDGIFLSDAEGLIRSVNPAGERMLGHERGEIVGRRATDLLASQDVVDRKPSGAEQESWEARRWDSVLLGEGGRSVEVELRVQTLESGFSIWIARDLTPRREILHRLSKIAGQVPGVVYQFKLRPDGTSCFPYASSRIREIYRVDPMDVVDDASPVFAVLHPEDYDGIVESITVSAETLQPWQYEYRVKFPDGEVRWLYGNSLPEMQSDGSILWHGFITDVTHRKQVEAKQEQIEAHLRQSQKIESIGRLAGGVAHDFNNILTAVLGSAELALGLLPPDSEAAQDLGRVVECAERGAALTHQLLAFARKRIVQPEAVELTRAVERIAPMIRRLLGEAYPLSLDLAPDAGVVKVDVGSLDQVIMNLAVNARDSMQDGGAVTLATYRTSVSEQQAEGDPEVSAGDYSTLEVTDTGTGLSEDVRARLFEPFFTTKLLGQGTGLGLAMCDGIVKQAGGHISVDSQVGLGTTFRVLLPRVEATVVDVRSVRPRPQRKGGHETVLLVEDDEMVLEVARRGLVLAGYEVLVAADPLVAVKIADETRRRIDLLLTDVVMPNMRGRDLAIRVARSHPETRVLFASGFSGDALSSEGVLEDDIEFLQKPYTGSVLQRRVREVLDRA